jgi:hypothetical protein
MFSDRKDKDAKKIKDLERVGGIVGLPEGVEGVFEPSVVGSRLKTGESVCHDAAYMFVWM